MIMACFLPFKFTKSHLSNANNFESFSNSYNEMMTKFNNPNEMKNIVFDKNELTYLNQNYYIQSSVLREKENGFYNKILSNTQHAATSKYNLKSSSLIKDSEPDLSNNLNLSSIATALNIHIEETDDKVTLSKPYSGKRIMLKSRNNVNPLDAVYIVKEYKGYQILQFATEESTKKAYEYYKSQPDIEFVVLDALITTSTNINFEDFNIDASPYMLTNFTSFNSWGANHIGADNYNQYLSTIDQHKKQTTYVAVLDSGVDTDHPFLSNRLDFTYARKYTYNKTTGETSTKDGKEFVEDAIGHGTHVAGIVADLTPSNVKIIPIKIIEDNNTGNLYSAVMALLYIADLKETKDVNICAANFSLGSTNTVAIGSDFHKSFSDATQIAREQDISIVVAAGNSSNDCINYCPANIAEVLTISNMTALKDKSSTSCYGSYIDLTAPGHQILSTDVDGGFKYLSGTSMAAPHVTACVALLNVYNYTENYTMENVEYLLLNNAIDLGETNWDGKGLVNLDKLIVHNITTYTIQLDLPNEVQLLTNSNLDNITEGSTIEFVINLTKGYGIDKVFVNGHEHYYSGNKIIIEDIQEDTTISVTVIELDEEIEYDIDLNFIITVAIIGVGALSLIGLAFAITKRHKPY